MPKPPHVEPQLTFTSDNSMTFTVVDLNGEAKEGLDDGYTLEWQDTPEQFAQQLRGCAEWLERHASDRIVIELD